MTYVPEMPLEKLTDAALLFCKVHGRPNYIAWLEQELAREKLYKVSSHSLPPQCGDLRPAPALNDEPVGAGALFWDGPYAGISRYEF